MADETTKSDANKLLRGWERLNSIKNQLIRAGLLNGNATPTDVLAKLREIIPQEIRQ